MDTPIPKDKQMKGDRRVLAEKKYSTHPDDANKSIVLCRWRNKEWVTWICTYDESGACSMHLGRYFDSAVGAALDFINRGTFVLANTEDVDAFMQAERRQHEEY